MPSKFETSLAGYLQGQTGQEKTWWALPQIIDKPAEKVEITPEIVKTSPEIQESKIKDIWDSFYVATKSLVQRGKDYFLSALPEMVFKDVKVGEPLIPAKRIGAIGITEFLSLPLTHTEQTVIATNERNQQIKEEREILWEQIFGAVEDIALITNRDTLKKDLGIIQHYISNLK